MKVMKDVIAGDEMFVDHYKHTLVHDVVYRVECKYVTRKFGEVVLAGANPSAEDAEEDVDDSGKESGVDVVLNQRLVETGFKDKKAYMVYLKEYIKAIAARLAEDEPDQVDKFKAGVNAFVKEKLSLFKDMQFFQGESMNVEGMSAILIYEESDEGEKPYMYFFKHGLLEEKV